MQAGELNSARPIADHTSLSLLERVKSNDQQAWQQLVHVYGPLVLKWCRRSGLRDEDAEDVFQETFRAVLSCVDGFQPTRSVGSFRSWLRTVTRTKIVDFFRRVERHPPGRGGSTATRQFADVSVPDDKCDSQADLSMVVHRAMELIKPEFSPQNWSSFQHVAIEGQSATDVAARLGINAQAVRQANYRIRRRLRTVLKDLAGV